MAMNDRFYFGFTGGSFSELSRRADWTRS